MNPGKASLFHEQAAECFVAFRRRSRACVIATAKRLDCSGDSDDIRTKAWQSPKSHKGKRLSGRVVYSRENFIYLKGIRDFVL